MNAWTTKLGVVLVMLSTSGAAGAKASARFHNTDRYDKSKDFSLHFDQEVRALRAHPTDDEPPRKPARHKRPRSMRP